MCRSGSWPGQSDSPSSSPEGCSPLVAKRSSIRCKVIVDKKDLSVNGTAPVVFKHEVRLVHCPRVATAHVNSVSSVCSLLNPLY